MSQRHPQHRRGTNHLSSPRQLLQLINSGRVAQLGEHLLCKRVRALQTLHPFLDFFNVFNNFGESASRSK